MFVRLVHNDGTATLFECGKADLIPNDRRHRVHLALEGVPGMNDVGVIVHKGRADLYFMNDDGKTIDSYNWPVFDTGRDDARGNRIFTGDKVKVEVATRSGSDVAVGKVKKKGSDFVVDYDSDSSDEKLDDIHELIVETK